MIIVDCQKSNFPGISWREQFIFIEMIMTSALTYKNTLSVDFYSDIHWLMCKSRETLHGAYLFIVYNSYYSVKKLSVKTPLIICFHLILLMTRRGSNEMILNRFNPATFLCLPQAKIWISINKCQGLICIQ